MQIKFRKTHPDAIEPSYSTQGAAGLDLHARIPHEIYLQSGVRFTCPTGIAIELPEGFEAQVRPRSGLASKNGITVLNSPGTIDCDYVSEIGVVLINHSDSAFTIKPNARIAQLVIAPFVRAKLAQVDSLTETGRGGFGSTGL